jgi:hypothetical protein
MQLPLRQALADRLASSPSYPTDRFEGRGIVICAGGQRYFTCAWVLISVLKRSFRTPLPIQVWHLGRAEMSESMRLILEEEGVEVVDAEVVVGRHPARVAGGWPLKPYAIAHSRFREVLYLDADTIPLVDPQQVFEWKQYLETGLLFWPDHVDLRKESPIWAEVALAPRDCVSLETGILAVDKQRAWQVLDLTVLLNEHWEEIYDGLYGDKDTFLVACLLLGQRHGLIEHRPFDFDVDLVQRDPRGEPFLHHRTGSKWTLSGNNRPVAAAEMTAVCEQALAELRRRWSGAIFHAPARSSRAEAEEARLIEARRFIYDNSGPSRRVVELLSGGRVGEGRAECEQHWAIVERDGELRLQFFSTTRVCVELARRSDGSWHGESSTLPPFAARLILERDRRSWPHADAKRIAHSAETVVASLLQGGVLGAGFDADAARDVITALALLNGVFDDVPEQVTARLAEAQIDARWRGALQDLGPALTAARDSRVALAERRAIPVPPVNPDHYLRVT